MAKRSLIILAVVLVNFLFSVEKLSYFYADGCKECLYITEKIIPLLSDKYELTKYCVSDYSGYLELRKNIGNKKLRPPIIVVDEKIYAGRKSIEGFLYKGMLSKQQVVRNTEVTVVSWLSITLAGLVDGINPCAMATLIFFITFLSFKKYSRSEILAIGLLFSLAVYFAYVLIGIGLVKFIFKLAIYKVLVNLMYAALSLACLFLAVISLRDALQKNPVKMLLQLPPSFKKTMHTILRKQYARRKP